MGASLAGFYIPGSGFPPPMEAVEARVLKRILPRQDEEARLHTIIHELTAKLSERIAARGLNAKPILVGSVAKGVHLHETEVDLFVAFSRDTPREKLESEGLALGDLLERPVRMYAEHPYTRGWYGGFEVEIVPCYRITDASQRMSAVDRTPLHVDYVLGHLSDEQTTEVRLLKAWAEGIGVYGAEAKVRGFSGYLCELLVIHYGTFHGVLDAARSWKPPIVIELGTPAARQFSEPLVVVDPVDGNRNVASAVSAEQLATFVYAARSYRKRPSPRFFFPRRSKSRTAAQLRATLKRRATSFLAVGIQAPKITDDVLYPQVRKAHKTVLDLFKRHGFQVLNDSSGVDGGDVLLLFEFEVFRLPRVEIHAGPPVWVKDAENFLRKWARSPRRVAGPYLRGDRWFVDVTREAMDAAALLRDTHRSLSLGRDLDRTARTRFAIHVDAGAVQKKYIQSLTDFFDRRFPWDR